MPRTRLVSVAAAIAPEAFNIFDTGPQIKVQGPKSKVQSSTAIGNWHFGHDDLTCPGEHH
jgi:hypothetical protein